MILFTFNVYRDNLLLLLLLLLLLSFIYGYYTIYRCCFVIDWMVIEWSVILLWYLIIYWVCVAVPSQLRVCSLYDLHLSVSTALNDQIILAAEDVFCVYFCPERPECMTTSMLTLRGGFRNVQHFGRTGALKIGGHHRPENAGQQRNIFRHVGRLHGVLRHLKVHLVQHDTLWTSLLLPYCETWNLRRYTYLLTLVMWGPNNFTKHHLCSGLNPARSDTVHVHKRHFPTIIEHGRAAVRPRGTWPL